MKIVANSTPLIELSKIRRLELLRDQSLEESENLPEPDVIAAEITENLEVALEQFASIYDEIASRASE